MKHLITLISLIIFPLWLHSTAHADEQAVTVVGAEFWATPHHAEQVLALKPLRDAVQQLLLEPEASLILHHPTGESGELWGQELQSWLVSLGITADRMELRAGYKEDDGVAVILVMPAAAEPPSDEPDQN